MQDPWNWDSLVPFILCAGRNRPGCEKGELLWQKGRGKPEETADTPLLGTGPRAEMGGTRGPGGRWSGAAAGSGALGLAHAETAARRSVWGSRFSLSIDPSDGAPQPVARLRPARHRDAPRSSPSPDASPRPPSLPGSLPETRYGGRLPAHPLTHRGGGWSGSACGPQPRRPTPTFRRSPGGRYLLRAASPAAPHYPAAGTGPLRSERLGQRS